MLAQKLLRWDKERIALKNAPNDDHGMRPHYVGHRVPPNLERWQVQITASS